MYGHVNGHQFKPEPTKAEQYLRMLVLKRALRCPFCKWQQLMVPTKDGTSLICLNCRTIMPAPR